MWSIMSGNANFWISIDLSESIGESNVDWSIVCRLQKEFISNSCKFEYKLQKNENKRRNDLNIISYMYIWNEYPEMLIFLKSHVQMSKVVRVQWVKHTVAKSKRQTLVPQRHHELMKCSEMGCAVCNRVKRLKGARARYINKANHS